MMNSIFAKTVQSRAWTLDLEVSAHEVKISLSITPTHSVHMCTGAGRGGVTPELVGQN
jgi:hypothetical protein